MGGDCEEELSSFLWKKKGSFISPNFKKAQRCAVGRRSEDQLTKHDWIKEESTNKLETTGSTRVSRIKSILLFYLRIDFIGSIYGLILPSFLEAFQKIWLQFIWIWEVVGWSFSSVSIRNNVETQLKRSLFNTYFLINS